MRYIENWIKTREARKEESNRLNRTFPGEYIIMLSKKVEATDEAFPYSYDVTEAFLCKSKGNPALGIKQLTGADYGKIYTDVKVDTQEDGLLSVAADEFSGTVDINKYGKRMLSVRELCSITENLNTKAKNDIVKANKTQIAIDAEFVEETEETIQEEVSEPILEETVIENPTEENDVDELDAILALLEEEQAEKLNASAEVVEESSLENDETIDIDAEIEAELANI